MSDDDRPRDKPDESWGGLLRQLYPAYYRYFFPELGPTARKPAAPTP